MPLFTPDEYLALLPHGLQAADPFAEEGDAPAADPSEGVRASALAPAALVPAMEARFPALWALSRTTLPGGFAGLGITSAGEKYAAAARELRALLLDAEPPSGPGAPEPARRRVLAHAEMLAALATGGDRALFLGFSVGFGTIRTLYVTIATVAFAVWGVLWGLGVVVTMDNVCR